MSAQRCDVDYFPFQVGFMMSNTRMLGKKSREFISLFIKNKKDMKRFEKDANFIDKLEKLIIKYTTKLETAISSDNLLYHPNFIIKTLIPLVKFIYEFKIIFDEIFDDLFTTRNAEIIIKLNKLQQYAEDIPLFIEIRNIYARRKDIEKILEAFHFPHYIEEQEFNAMYLELSKNEDLLNQKYYKNFLKKNPDVEEKRKCDQLHKDLDKFFEKIKRKHLNAVLQLRKIIDLRCRNCDRNIYYLIEHIDGFDSDKFILRCVNCCSRHEKTLPVLKGFYEKNCIEEKERQFSMLNNVINKYKSFHHELSKDDITAFEIEEDERRERLLKGDDDLFYIDYQTKMRYAHMMANPDDYC